MKKIIVVFGTRPEAIKMAPVCIELNKHKDIKLVVCVTAQHREMLDQVLNIFNIFPQIDLDVMKKGQDLFEITSTILLKMRNVFKRENPDLVLVHGDTTTSFVTALACFYEKIKVGHVEAGLRTYDINSPFPEELNRQITGLITDYHFAPTKLSKENLISEGKKKESIIVTGNTVIDAMSYVLNNIEKDKHKNNHINESLDSILGSNWKESKYVLITGHRRENFGKGFQNICKAIQSVAKKNKDINFIYPVHLNPNVKSPVMKILSGHKNIFLIDPIDYENFLYLMRHSYVILTDSGGIQEEAPSLGKPVLVMRDTTERPEGVDSGTVMVVGTSLKSIENNLDLLLNDKLLYNKMSQSNNPYGDGNASKRIVKFILQKLKDVS
ncbi:UDP-N-acetylglucosamine 2-epimerase (non-hydrolyzing) [Gammaproteobacteria bacterium]|nr:UDP-N-acetylglucosamine 2-epimerase (non-hydrolyzing) [Gammaproteobacteria bacterium]